jgi:hypothetical protein
VGEIHDFSIGNLKFIDSYQFMNGSLEKLTESLKNKTGDPYEKFEIMKAHFSKEELELMTKCLALLSEGKPAMLHCRIFNGSPSVLNNEQLFE